MPGWLLFGGSFDPVHHGHLVVARAVGEALGVSRIVLIPARRPPHKEGIQLAPGDDRLEMCRRAVADEPLFAVDDCELHRAGPSYTLDTVRHFRARASADLPLHWLIGMDSWHDLHRWHQLANLLDEAQMVTAARPGWTPPPLDAIQAVAGPARAARLAAGVIAAPQIEISATQVRQRVAHGQSIRWLTPPVVAEWIAARHLYRRVAPGGDNSGR